MGRAIDLFVTYRFLKLLVTPWEKQDAYKLGIIDANGKALKKSKDLTTEAEREAFTLLHRLIFNCKRIMGKIPLVRTKLGTYATALFLLKENRYDINEKEVYKYLLENNMVDFDNTIQEEVIGIGSMLPAGEYSLVNQVTADDEEVDAQEGDAISVIEDTPPSDTVLGMEIFPVIHVKSMQKIYVSLEDIK